MCNGCHACYNICPVSSLSMEIDDEGFLYPKINKETCINCNLCNKVCPLTKDREVKSKKIAYACYNKDENIRMKSSSGGIFTSISNKVLNENGVVFGAAFNETFEVTHIKVDKEEDLNILRGSKYVQSNINTTFKQVKKYLDEDRMVLFSGTPCQIGGLKSFLGKDYNKLLCIDLICHGVPSPIVWKSYLEEIEKGKKLNEMTFRDKSKGWSEGILKYTFEDKTEYVEEYANSKYIKGFIKNCYLRPSCYKCKFKTLDRESDITLGDFWGIENIEPQMNDNKGISICMIHTDKGEEIFNKIKDSIVYKEVNIESAIKENICAIESVKLDKKRKKFYKLYNKNMSIMDAIDKSIEESKEEKLVKSLKYTAHRVKNKMKQVMS